MKSSEAKSSAVFKNTDDYRQIRNNECCKCKSKEDLSLHHVFPKCYIQKRSDEISETLKVVYRELGLFSYDCEICCLCVDCHHEYEENYTDKIHEKIRYKYQIDLKDTSYRNQYSNLPKPSEIVMDRINNSDNPVRDYLELRNFCIGFFMEQMKCTYISKLEDYMINL